MSTLSSWLVIYHRKTREWAVFVNAEPVNGVRHVVGSDLLHRSRFSGHFLPQRVAVYAASKRLVVDEAEAGHLFYRLVILFR